MYTQPYRLLWTSLCLAVVVLLPNAGNGQPKERNYPYVEMEGTAQDFQYHREWRSYYWRDDFTFSLKDADGKLHRVISREPTPWNNLKLGTTYTGLKVDWKKNPKVKIIGVQAIDRLPEEFYDLKLDPKNTITAFIVRVWDESAKTWRDYYVNNWFHKWGPETDAKVAAHYITADPNYTIYGYVTGAATTFDQPSQELLKKSEPDWGGMIYHAKVVKAKAGPGHELQVLHLMGRHKKTAEYKVFFGDPAQIIKLDQNKPK